MPPPGGRSSLDARDLRRPWQAETKNKEVIK